MDQHFLCNPERIRRFLDAADIQPHESVLELGAGKGTVSRFIPECRTVTLLELDKNLARSLRRRFTSYRVICADATELLPRLAFDVLLGNLPFYLTDEIIEILRDKEFRCAVLSVREDQNLASHGKEFRIDEITLLDEQDFSPAQNYKSRLVRLTR